MGHSGVSDDGGLDLHGWGLDRMRRWRWGLTRGWSRGNGLRWRRTHGGGAGEDRQCGVLDRQVRGDERLSL